MEKNKFFLKNENLDLRRPAAGESKFSWTLSRILWLPFKFVGKTFTANWAASAVERKAESG